MTPYLPYLIFALTSLAGWALYLDRTPFAWGVLIVLFLGWVGEIGRRSKDEPKQRRVTVADLKPQERNDAD